MLQRRHAPQTTMISSPSRRAWRRSCCSLSVDLVGSAMIMKTKSESGLSRLLESLPDQFRQIFHRQRAVIEDGSVKTAQVKLVAQLALDLLPQPIERRSPHKVHR